MHICLISPEREQAGGLGISLLRLARTLAREHEVTMVHSYAEGPGGKLVDEPSLRHLLADPERLPSIAFSCEDHRRSAAVLAAIEEAYGDRPPDYLEAPDRHAHGLVPLQARNGGHRSLRGTAIAVRLSGAVELTALVDGTWPTPPERMVFDLEREALRLCDRVVWPGGDVLGLYRRVLGSPGLERETRLRLPLEPAPPQTPTPSAETPLRILYAGRLGRAEGPLELVEACLRLGREDWRLTLVGADTETAPLAQSVHATIDVMAAGNERVTVLDPVPEAELRELYGRHDLLVVPACHGWSVAALEAMQAGLPVLGAPLGGLSEQIADGVTGWHLEGPGARSIEAGLRRLLGDRAELARVRDSGAPAARARELGDPDAVRAEYRQLLEELRPTGPGVRVQRDRRPRVTGVVTYFGEHEEVAGAVDSLLGQTYPELDVLIVDDGHFEEGDEVLAELAARDRVRVLYQLNRGETGARNLGALDADGEYLAFIDSDNHFEPDFVARAVAMLEADPELAYVTCWLRFFDDGDGALEQVGTGGYAPLGNAVRSDESINSDGDTMSVVRRRFFTRLGYRFHEDSALLADWEFYRRLREGGHYGTVIPELLANYKVRFTGLSQTYSGSGHRIAWDESLSRRRSLPLEWARPR